MTTAFMEYQERLLASAAAVANLGDLDEIRTHLSDRTAGENESQGTHRTASMSEILSHHDSETSANDIRSTQETGDGFADSKENSFVVLNIPSPYSKRGESNEVASLQAYEQELKSELAMLNEKIYQVHLERETLELEKEITVDEAKAKLAKLKAEADRQTERLRKADAHLEKVKQKQRDIQQLKAAQMAEIDKLVEISEGLVKESRVIEMKTREVEVTVYEYGKRLGMEDNRENSKASASHNEHEGLPPVGGGIQFAFAEKKGLLKMLRATTRKVLPKKKTLFGSRTPSGPIFGTIEFQKEEAEKEQEYLLRQLEMANEELLMLEGDQEGKAEGDLEHATLSMTDDDSNVSG